MRRLMRGILVLLFCAMAAQILLGPTPAHAAISGQQATNDNTNVYYQYNFTGAPGFWHVYVDTDQSATTGYKVQGIGANFMLENGTLYRYSGTGGAWGWTSVKTVTYSNSAGLAKWTVARADLGDTACPNADNLVFDTA